MIAPARDTAPSRGDASPWGPIQDVTPIADGIVFASTASHGGVWLAPERRAAMPPALAAVEPYAGTGWYEEDEDIAIVILSFPETFQPYAVWSALQSRFLRPGLKAAAASWSDAVRERAEEIATTWELEHGRWWRVGGCGTDGNGWTVSFTQVGTGDRAVRWVEQLPTEQVVQELPGEPAGKSRVERGGS